MGKLKRLFVCSTCERPAAQWSGRCISCGSWGTVSEHPAGSTARADGRPPPPVLRLAPDPEERRISTGLTSVDRVLGGGLVRGSVVLVAGAPGIGKSTLLLQLASYLTAAGRSCLLASGEEARGQIAARAERLGLDGSALAYVPGRELDDVIGAARAERPAVLIVDSIQTLRNSASDALAGGVAQVRGCADALVALAKEEGIAVLLVGHVTKEGDVAGPRTLEHAVDAVLTFEGEPHTGRRLLAGGKNRYGPEGEVAWFAMTGGGLTEVDAAPVGSGARDPGCAVGAVLAGRRAFAAEVQALVVRVEGPPRRQVTGLDPRRFHIVAAVTDQALRLGLSRAELFGAAPGGLRIEDPGMDLALAAALASAGSDKPAPPATAFVGEIGLSGALRPVAGLDQRLAAAAAAGIEQVIAPGGTGTGRSRAGLRVGCAPRLADALAWATGARAAR
jgi:DNA repair protein RadA/Sms